MFKDNVAMSSFSVNDIDAAEKFYGETLGLGVEKNKMGLIIKLAGGQEIFVYPKDNHEPATFTILNFMVDDIDKAVADLSSKGIKLEHYDNMTDEKGIARGIAQKMGPDIAWFKDPAGNVLSVLHDE